MLHSIKEGTGMGWPNFLTNPEILKQLDSFLDFPELTYYLTILNQSMYSIWSYYLFRHTAVM